ncbi:Ubiquitin thioesterase OTU1 [Hondaea fermentalgiana]|uniref:Ubiquitin thioesterase OTU n=1 Tax=Hondaea fermentalgiana TaxID=2315210 RepID=A0A2R5GCU2_9STRA|nr:Ubiquitin thioesterase OTU1 [Hondaea fermentalgiana]|eukprot:GBG28786.1 Ubiquitin thioesterase OTU1 [Hondaea fermentalgiana]
MDHRHSMRRAQDGHNFDDTKSKSDEVVHLSCDRCDSSEHTTDACPWFKKGRDKHPDAQRRKMLSMGGDSDGKVVYLQNARIVTMPGDGNCLFHSLCYGLGGVENAGTLRRKIADFIARNPKLLIADTPLEDWVNWDSNKSVREYAQRMARSGWGGGIECAACSHLMHVNVHIYEREKKASSASYFSRSRSSRASGGGFKRISCFNLPGATRTVRVLYCGGIHYNALVV